jgi:hypothetical protein
VSLASFATIEPSLLERIGDMEDRERRLVTPPALTVIPPGRDVARRWQAAPMEARRQVARLLLSPEILGQLRVRRAEVRGQVEPAADRAIFRRS